MALTKIRKGAPLVRETAVFEHTDPLVVTLYPQHLTLRLKGSDEAYALSYAKLMSYARGLATSGIRQKAAR